jgi:hypothetical protein
MRFLSGGMLLLMFVFSFAGCKNQQPESPASNTPPPVPPAIAPGSIALTGSISDCVDGNRALTCTLSVASVQEYGAGTTQLPAGTQLLVSVRQAVIDAFQGDAEAAYTGRDLAMTIVAERPAPDDKSLPAWRVTALDLP